jgi:hypothetical protein
MNKLQKIQSELKAPKGQFNKFGGFRYRNAEDILEALKPLLAKYECVLTISDEIVLIGERYYVKATATISFIDSFRNNDQIINDYEERSVSAYAREEDTKKGMDGSQITGAASSYARKYALNGLFAIDDTKDADSHENKSEVSDKQIEHLLRLLETSTYDSEVRSKLGIKIKSINTLNEFNNALYNLESNQLGIEGAVNPSQKEVNTYLKKTGKQ